MSDATPVGVPFVGGPKDGIVLRMAGDLPELIKIPAALAPPVVPIPPDELGEELKDLEDYLDNRIRVAIRWGINITRGEDAGLQELYTRTVELRRELSIPLRGPIISIHTYRLRILPTGGLPAPRYDHVPEVFHG